MINQAPYKIIKIDKYTNKIERPTLLLEDRSFNVIGEIGKFDAWKISLNANSVDEISFTVHKYVNNKLCPVWDDLIDLKIVEVKGFGRYEIHVSYEDEAETIKTITAQSLEVELGQIILRNFHVNDEEAMDMVITDYTSDDYDENGNFIPTVFYNENDIKHSLLHRVLADKAPHWSIGYVTPYVVKGEGEIAELSSSYQRMYTVDGTSIYDFLTGTVAEETNVVFVFDTYNRKINVYSLYDCYNEEGTLLVSAIGEDTGILISKNKLAKQISINSNADEVKNCFYVTGGDDIITSYVAAVNMSGNNYIYQFADFQLYDMPEELRNKILSYQTEMANHEDEYYGESGIFTRLCKAYEDLTYYESSMMPEVTLSNTTAKEQFDIVTKALKSMTIGVYSESNYSASYFSGISNNVVSMASVLVDSRYEVSVIDETTSYNPTNKQWTGTLKFKRANTDETDVYPAYTNVSDLQKYSINVSIAQDNDKTGLIPYTEQKIYKALQSASISDENFKVESMSETEMKEYFNQYSLNYLKIFYDGYNACISVLCELGKATTDTTTVSLYNTYKKRLDIIDEIYKTRQAQVDKLNKTINNILTEQAEFQKEWNFETYLGEDLYKLFCSYRRESEYNNSNYISDALITSDGNIDDTKVIQKAKELLDVAKKEIKKACVLQRTVQTSINNLLVLPEFENLYDSFSLFNYIRVKSDDEIFKLRLISISFSDDSIENIEVGFSENVLSLSDIASDTVNDVQNILSKASTIATSYSYTAKQADQGAKAQNTFQEIYSSGLNAAKMMLKNSDNNELTMSQSGLICKRMDDEGSYGNKQLRIIGNGIYMTNDDWKTVNIAIGESLYMDPSTGETSWKYGVIAENIVGKLIVGEKLYISNTNGTVQITGDGLFIYDASGNPMISAESNGNAEFNGTVTASSGKIGNWFITNSRITSSKSIYLSSAEAGMLLINESDKPYIVCQNNNGVTQFSIARDGAMTAKNANITGTISSSTITGGTIKIGSKFSVDSSGNMIATGGEFNGKIISESGTIGGFTIGSSKIYAGDSSTGVIVMQKPTSSNIYAFACGGTSHDSYASCPFRVTKAGKLYAKDAVFENHIYVYDEVNQKNIAAMYASGGLNFPSYCYFEEDVVFDNSNVTFHGTVETCNTSFGNSNAIYSLRPSEDATFSLGTSGHRFKNIYAETGSINPSDRNLKNTIQSFTEKHEELFSLLHPVTYKFNSGERTHFGFISQELKESMDTIGFSDMDIAAYCRDAITQTIIEDYTDESGETRKREIETPVLDEDGNAKYIYSIRYQEIIALNTHMIQKCLAKINELELEIERLKSGM